MGEVFSLFKGYSNTQFEALGKLLENHSKIEKSAAEFEFSVSTEQFEVNAKLERLLSRIKTSADDPHLRM